jgi:hypothetical protein
MGVSGAERIATDCWINTVEMAAELPDALTEIARLRAAVVEFLSGHYPNNGDGRTSHLTWTIPEKAFGDLRYALDAGSAR